MFTSGDANTFTKHLKLFHGTPKQGDKPIGDLTADYYILQFNDIKTAGDTGSPAAKLNRHFLITCTQRI